MSASPPKRPAQHRFPDERLDPAWRWFAGLFLALLAAHVGLGLVGGELTTTPFGLLFAPLFLASGLTVAGMCVRELARKRWAHGGVGVLVLSGGIAALTTGCVSRPILFPGSPQPLPAAGTAIGPDALVVGYETEDGLALKGLLVRPPAAGSGASGAAGEAGAAPGGSADEGETSATDALREREDGRGGHDVGDPEATDGGPRRPVLLYFHGNAESAAQNLDVARAFAARGFDVFVAEYRGFGGCPGSPSEAGLLRDGRAAARAATERTGASPEELILVGRSLGSGVASGLAAEGIGRGVILLSPFTSVLDVAETLVPRWLARLALRDRFENEAALAGARQPVLVVHGDRDEVIPYRLGARLAERLGPRGRLVTLRGIGHNDLFFSAGREVIDASIRFVSELERQDTATREGEAGGR